MAEKQKTTKKRREHKESSGKNAGARPFPNGGMTDIQKVLIANGGMAHRLRSGKSILAAPKTRKSRADKQAAR